MNARGSFFGVRHKAPITFGIDLPFTTLSISAQIGCHVWCKTNENAKINKARFEIWESRANGNVNVSYVTRSGFLDVVEGFYSLFCTNLSSRPNKLTWPTITA